MTEPHRALPTRMIDLIRSGVPTAALREAGDRAVYRTLVSTAASAQQRGHTFPEWAELISQAASNLGRQAKLRSGGKEKTKAAYEKTLRSAWDAAAKWLTTAAPALTREDALEHVAVVRDWVADADSPLDDNERAVMAAACVVAARIGTTRPALARRALIEETGLGERTVRTTLARLDARGVLRLEVPGRSGADAGRRRAALYRLPDREGLGTSYLYRETRSMGPPAQIYGTPPNYSNGTPPQIYGTPTAPTTPEELAVVTLTISANDPAALAAVLDTLRRQPAVEVQQQPPTELPGRPAGATNVRPLRRRSA